MLGSEKFRAREKRLLIQELLRPGQKLSGGSKYLNCRWIFGSAKFDCGIRNVAGPAKKIAGSGKVLDPWNCSNPWKKIASPENVDLLKKNFACGSEYSNYLSNIRIREKGLSDPQEMNCWAQKVAGSEEENAGSGNVGPLKRTDARI